MKNVNTEVTEITLIFHTDPGHGWLEVPASMAKQYLRDKYRQISCYSYQKNGVLFLEEDCDASLFLTALAAENIKLHLDRKHLEITPIRGYKSFNSHVH
jgi:hypothetical protein